MMSITTIVRDPIEHISINEDCHRLEEKKCELNTALKKYLSIEVTDELKTLFAENQENNSPSSKSNVLNFTILLPQSL